MKSSRWIITALLAGFVTIPSVASARPLSVSVSTNRGNEAVYQPGDRIELSARVSEDAFLLVYEIDAEGFVHLLHPRAGLNERVEGGATTRIPDQRSDVELVVQDPVGEGYIVAIASMNPFEDLPWYLRPRNAQAEEIGYEGAPEENDEQGVTAEGRIVGDPFVAMERIRRRVVGQPNDLDSFASAYTSYYVHHEVRYPRYLCYDCHRPGRWSWWDGFDPYYATCSVMDYRVNWSWSWGPRYWCGFVPYYVFVYRTDCPPRYRARYDSGRYYSSWDGWRRWRTIWGARLTRFKTPPPSDYAPPRRFVDGSRGRGDRRIPPGFLAGDQGRSRRRDVGTPPHRGDFGDHGRGAGSRGDWGSGRREREPRQTGGFTPGREGEVTPGRRSPRDDGANGGDYRTPRVIRGGNSEPPVNVRPRRDERPSGSDSPRDGGRGRVERPGPAPEPVREIRPSRNDDRRDAPAPRQETRAPSRGEYRSAPSVSPDLARGEKRRWR